MPSLPSRVTLVDVGPPDARELAAFTELENKLVDASRRVKSVSAEKKRRKREKKEKANAIDLSRKFGSLAEKKKNFRPPLRTSKNEKQQITVAC